MMIKITMLVVMLACTIPTYGQNNLYDSLLLPYIKNYSHDTAYVAKVRTEKINAFKAAQKMYEENKFGYFFVGNDGDIMNHFLIQCLLLKKFNLYSEFTGCTSSNFALNFNIMAEHLVKQDFNLMRTIVKEMARENEIYQELKSVSFSSPENEIIPIPQVKKSKSHFEALEKKQFLSKILNQKLDAELKKLNIKKTEEDVCFYVINLLSDGKIDQGEFYYFGKNEAFYSALKTVCEGMYKFDFVSEEYSRVFQGRYLCIKFPNTFVNERQYAKIFSPVNPEKVTYHEVITVDEEFRLLFDK